MTKLRLLKLLTKVLHIIFTAFLVLLPGLSLVHYIMPQNVPVNFRIDDVANSILNSSLLLILKGSVTVYAIYMFRKILEAFSKKIFFDDLIIKYLDRVGKCLIGLLMLEELPQFIIKLLDGEFNLFTNPLYALFILIGGFFFMVLAEVFRTAKNLKEENDLTV